MSWYIRSLFGFSFRNILYFLSTLVLTSSIDVVFILSIKEQWRLRVTPPSIRNTSAIRSRMNSLLEVSQHVRCIRYGVNRSNASVI